MHAPMTILEAHLNSGERILAEAGSMVYIKGDIDIKTKTHQGGFLSKLKVSTIGGESFFVNEYSARGDNCIVGLTGKPLGDIAQLKVSSNSQFIVQSGAFVASSEGVELDTQWQGFTKGLFGSQFFMLKTNGEGEFYVNSYGSILSQELGDGEKLILDNYHLLAISEDTHYRVTKLGGIKTSLFGGEGLVTEITGPGIVYMQTKNIRELVDLLGQYFDKRYARSK